MPKKIGLFVSLYFITFWYYWTVFWKLPLVHFGIAPGSCKIPGVILNWKLPLVPAGYFKARMAGVVTNFVKNGFTHMKTYDNVPILCCSFVRRLCFLLLYVSLLFVCFNAIFTIMTPLVCALWICENNVWRSCHIKDTINVRVWKVYFEPPCTNTKWLRKAQIPDNIIIYIVIFHIYSA